MILVKRLDEPQKLKDNKKKWAEKFLERHRANPKSRPWSSQYAHPDVRKTLRAMSYGKCFYCEKMLGEKEDEVDHYEEVARKPDLAFVWTNLYLSCSLCNDKLPSIDVKECIDPCGDEQPGNHITFDEEFIFSRTDKGAQTIKKYGLKRGELDLQRTRQMKLFYKTSAQIEKRIRLDNREISEEEREVLESFGREDRPFSLMFRVLLQNMEIC